MTLTEFLAARFDEDERLARSSIGGGFTLSSDEPLNGKRAVAAIAWADHSKRWSPARVLAEMDAKRQMLEWYKAVAAADDRQSPEGITAHMAALGFLGLPALPYADHPDYRDEWRL